MAASSPHSVSTPTLTLAGGTRLSKALPKDQPFVIGSAREADFRIPHPSLLARHAVLIWNGRITRIEPGAPNASDTTLINGQPLKSPSNLRDGDHIRIGEFEFDFQAPKHRVQEASPPQLTVTYRGQQVSEVPLTNGQTFGRGEHADVRLEDNTLLAVHAIIEQSASGFVVLDQGGAGLLANGRYFEKHPLLIGDRLDFGEEHSFVFEGWCLRRVPRQSGCALTAQNIEVRNGARALLKQAGFAAASGEFIGIIGPSGAGKTTLLRALCGLNQLAEGTVFLNRTRREQVATPSSYFGYVPQQEIVHLELTGRQALRYAAALRLPARAPAHEIEKLILELARQLGLEEHLDTPAKRLSGGQLKRLSVAVEMLSQPPLLLLDEPTSGLDPESETQLMRQLRELTATGCTVICSTHLMENVHLMDSVEILGASVRHGEAGTTVFRGRPSTAKDFFDAKDLATIYSRLQERRPSEWRADFEKIKGLSADSPTPPPEPVPPPPKPHHKRRTAIPVLLARQWRVLGGDLKNLLLLLGQPLLIGLLLALAAGSAADQSATKLFLACIATFWMACGNAAPEIVRERAIFERERFAGLRLSSYLGAKYLGLGLVSLLQALILWLVLKLAGGLTGHSGWQWLALFTTVLAATSLGLMISSWARNVLQAVLLVPVFTIPQILFSGYVFKLEDWNHRAVPRVVSRAFPGFASQRIVDTSLMWQQPVGNYDDMDKAGLVTSYENLATALRPFNSWLGIAPEAAYQIDEAKLYNSARGLPLRIRSGNWDAENPLKFRLGGVYAWSQPAIHGVFILLVWCAVGLGVSLIFLHQRRE